MKLRKLKRWLLCAGCVTGLAVGWLWPFGIRPMFWAEVTTVSLSIQFTILVVAIACFVLYARSAPAR